MDYKKSPKNRRKFNCEKCDYICYKASDYNKHLLTLKHTKETKELQMDYNLSQMDIFECACGSKYKHRQGLWKHKKKCVATNLAINPPLDSSSDILVLTNLVLDVVKQNQELTNKIVDICKNNNSNSNYNSNNNNILNNNFNSNNKTFNLNVFLNETCKDAMNITDFVDSLNMASPADDSRRFPRGRPTPGMKPSERR